LQARLTNGESEILMATRSGRAIRFNETQARCIGRTGAGVRGITLASEHDEVVGMVCVKDTETEDILVVSEKGYGKRSKTEDYRVTNRGGKGVKTMNISEKTGELITIKNVTDDNDLMIINRSGIAIRLSVSEMRVMGRATQGVRLINLSKKQDDIASVAKVRSEAAMENEVYDDDDNDEAVTENTKEQTNE
jgi:DNA gyrase subunit A